VTKPTQAVNPNPKINAFGFCSGHRSQSLLLLTFGSTLSEHHRYHSAYNTTVPT